MKTNPSITEWLLLVIIIITTHTTNIRINNLKEVNFKQDSLFNDMYYSVIDTTEKEAFLVTMTTYSPTKGQTDSSPDKTAAGFKINTKNPFIHRYIGLSRDLLEDFRYGEIVILQNAGPYNGYYVVADCMNSRFVRYVDILIGNKQKHTKLKDVILKHANDD
jgi:3D (Asp-Asp-Asp) domain-containing protein